MNTTERIFNSKRLPEKWRRHFKIYRAKISIYLDTPDFGVPLMIDASEMMDFLPERIDQAVFLKNIGPVKPGGEATWLEAEVREGLPSRTNVRRIGAMVHRSTTRTSFLHEPFTGADHEYWIEAYWRDTDGLSAPLDYDVRFRLDGRGFLSGLELMPHRNILPPGRRNPFTAALEPVLGQGPETETVRTAEYDARDQPTALAVEVMNRVFFTLALMNCRNVKLRERGSSKTAGPGQTGDAFHEVVIDGSIHQTAQTSGAHGTLEGRRHLARGHFKTFTEDAPLLGKHVGTYWWGWQVRGQESRGVIEKTYTLRPGRR